MAAQTSIVHESKTKLPEYAEACYLAEQIEWYANLKGEELLQQYKHLALSDPNTTDSTTIMNQLRGHGTAGQNFFQDVPKSIAGDFQPYIKIFKINPQWSHRAKSDKDILIPLEFNNLKNLGIMDSRKLGVAFRSFTFDFEGTRPVEIDAYVRCSLKLYFESPQALFEKYGEKGKSYQFADLIRRAVIHKSVDKDKRHLLHDERYYRIRVDIGYNSPSTKRLTEAYSAAGFSNPRKKAENLQAALRTNKMQIYLNLLKHSISPVFDAPDGGFELSVDYVGSIETSFRSKAANILFAPKNNAAAKQTLEAKKQFQDKQDAAFDGLDKEGREKLSAHVSSKKSFKDMLEKEVAETTQEDIKAAGQSAADIEDQKQSQSANLAQKAGFDAAARVARVQAAGRAAEAKAATKANTPEGRADIEIRSTVELLHEEFNIGTNPHKAQEIKSYLEYNDFRNNTALGQTIFQAKAMSRMYSRILDELTARKQLHYVKVQEYTLYSWFGAKQARVKAQSQEDRLKEIAAEQSLIEKAFPQSEEQLARNKELQLEKETIEHDQRQKTSQGAPPPPPKPPTPQTAAAGDKHATASDAAVADKARAEAVKVREEQLIKQGSTSTPQPHTEVVEPASLSERPIYFFYYGDLLDVVLAKLYEFKSPKHMDLNWWSTSNKKGNIKFMLGEVEFQHPQTRKLVKESLARVPITLKVWQEFWIENVIDQWKTEYSFGSFLNDTLSQLVLEALTGRCKQEGNVNISVSGYPSYLTIDNINNKVIFKPGKAGQRKKHYKKTNPKDEAYYYSYGRTKPSNLGDLNSGENDPSNLKSGELIFVSAGNKSGRWFQNNKTQDNRRGIYHIELGRENSTILNFTMNRSNQPHYLETKLESAGINDTVAFGEPYNYDITMFGNALLIPGKHLKVSFPRGWFSATQEEQLGVGGYCFVLKTKNEVKALDSRLEWTTNMQCLWQSFGGNSHPPIANSGRGSKPSAKATRTPQEDIDQHAHDKEKPNQTDVKEPTFVPVGQAGKGPSSDVAPGETPPSGEPIPEESALHPDAQRKRDIVLAKKHYAAMAKTLSTGIIQKDHPQAEPVQVGMKADVATIKATERHMKRVAGWLREQGEEP